MVSSIIGRNNIHVIFCSESKYLVDTAVRIARKDIEDVSSTAARSTGAIKDVPFITKFFMNVDGIGIETAENLSRKFKSVQKAIEAEEEDFRGVDGIGEKTAQKLVQTIQEGSDKSKVDDGPTMIRI
jgi:ERCC4-type nuclease